MPLLHSISTMKARPRLQDIPYLIKRRITGHLEEYYEKMSLQTAFPHFRTFIGDLHFDCDSFMLAEESGGIQMTFQKDSEVFEKKYGKLEMAANDFKMLVENPNFSIQKLVVKEASDSSFLSKIGSVLTNLKAKLRVKHMELTYNGNQEDILRILANLGALESLILEKGPLNQEKVFQLDQVMKLEQWKRLKAFQIFDYKKNTLPIELKWKNPNRKAKLAKVKLVDLKRIVEFFRKAPDFDSFEIKTNFTERELAVAMKTSKVDFERIDDELWANFPRTPTKFPLHVEIHEDRIKFNRKSYWERQGQDDASFNKMKEEDDEEDDNHFDSQRVMDDLKLKFCKAIKEPVMVGMDQGVVKHFEWDREMKTWRKRSCEVCKGDVEMFNDGEYYFAESIL